MRLQQSHPYLHTEKGRTCRQSGDVCYFTQPVAVAVLGSRPVDVCRAPYIPSTNLEEWVTQKSVSEPSQVCHLCTNLVRREWLQVECGGT